MSIKNVVLVGAGGNLGPTILKGLLDASFNVTVLSRHSSKSTFPSTVKVARIADDYPTAELVSIFKGHEAVVCTVGGEATAQQTRMIDAALEAGVQRFIPAEFGSLPRPNEPYNPVFVAKEEIRNHLISLESKGLTWTGIANNAFFEWGLQVGFLRVNPKARTASTLDGGNARFPLSSFATIGKATAGVLQHPEETKNRMVYVQTYSASQKELITAVEKVVGEPLKVEDAPYTTFVAEEGQKLKQGDASGVFGLIWAHIQHGTDWSGKLDNKLLGIPDEDFESSLKKVVEGILKA